MANVIALDVGTKFIGVAVADTVVPIAMPLMAVAVDGSEVAAVETIIKDKGAETIIVGYPRNQSGDPTEQTAISEAFGDKMKQFGTVVYQDESLTSVMAEDRLKASGKSYGKADIDAAAAAIILQDYLEVNHAA